MKRRSRSVDSLLRSGEGAFIAPGSSIEAPTQVGRFTRINGLINVRGSGPCTIGQFCAIGADVSIITQDHDLDRVNLQLALFDSLDVGVKPIIVGAVEIGDNAWIGDGVTLLKHARVGIGAAIGAGAVVTGAIPPFSVAAGVPARVMRPRCGPEVAECLLRLAWWDWPID